MDYVFMFFCKMMNPRQSISVVNLKVEVHMFYRYCSSECNLIMIGTLFMSNTAVGSKRRSIYFLWSLCYSANTCIFCVLSSWKMTIILVQWDNDMEWIHVDLLKRLVVEAVYLRLWLVMLSNSGLSNRIIRWQSFALVSYYLPSMWSFSCL